MQKENASAIGIGWGKVNILVTGKTGVGKSTLINSIFSDVFSLPPQAETGVGKSITQHIRKHTDPSGQIPICFFDTPGLELEKYQERMAEVKSFVKSRTESVDSEQHIHCAWLCISEDSSRIEEAEQHLCNFLAKTMPVIVVITKSRTNNADLEACVRKLLPAAIDFTRIRSIDETFHTPNGSFTLPSVGLNVLVELTGKHIPEGKAKARDLALVNTSRSNWPGIFAFIWRWFLARA